MEDRQVMEIGQRQGIKAGFAHNKFNIRFLSVIEIILPGARTRACVRVAGEITFEIGTPFDAMPDYSLANEELWKSIHYQVVVTCSPELEFSVYH